MPKGGHGRGVIAAIGLVVLFAGLVGGGVLWVLAEREPESAAESFARAVTGCTTTLTFGEPGEFYVFEELSGIVAPVDGCQPSTLAGRPFTFTVTTTTGVEVPRVADDSVSYDLDVGSGTSVARITIPDPGEYRISVIGSDPAVVAAIGGDPDDGVQQLRQGAIAAVAAGLVLGGFLLWLSARRSRKAASFAGLADPGWGVTERDHARRAEAQREGAWPPVSPDVRQVPINPMAPDDRRVAEPWSAPGPDAAPAPIVAPPIVAPPIAEPPVAESPLAATSTDGTSSEEGRSSDRSAADASDAVRAAPAASSPAVAWPSDLEPSPERDDADASSSDDDDTSA